MSGLEQTFPGRVTAHNVDASTGAAREEVKALGFEHHGLVVRSTDGRILMKQPDHEVQIEVVEAALRKMWDN